jgi:hypothetical protein
MSAPVKPFLGLVAAFAGGVAATVAFVGHQDRAPETAAASKPANVASLAASPHASNGTPAADGQPPSDTGRWVDPTKHSTPAPAAHSSLPPLVFHLDDKPEHSKSSASRDAEQAEAGQTKNSTAAQVLPPRRPARLELEARPEVASRSIVAASTADRTPPPKPSEDLSARKIQAHRLTAEPSRKSATARVASNESLKEGSRTVATKPADHTPLPKPSDNLAANKLQSHRLTAKLRHRSEPVRVAVRDDYDDDEGPTVERQIRRVYVPSRRYGYTAEQPYARRYVELSDPYESDVGGEPRQYRRETTSSQPSGVMRWLTER